MRSVTYLKSSDLRLFETFQLVAKRVQTIEKNAAMISPEFSAFQAQLASLLADLEERKKAGGSPDAAYHNSQVIREKLELLQQFAATTTRVRILRKICGVRR